MTDPGPPEPESREVAGPRAVVARGLVVAYGSRVGLRASGFSVPSGSLTAVIGPNGSGKSTMLHAVAGLVAPRDGSLEVLGSAPASERERVAYVFQSTKVNERMPLTVAETVAMGRYATRGFFGRLGADDRAAVEGAMSRLDVDRLRNQHLRELSGGERQRVFVAQGLAQGADLLLLDEPLTGLDIPSHERIDRVVAEECSAGRTVVLTTHDVAEAARADHVLLLGGRVVAEGPPADVLTAEALARAYGDLLHLDESPLAAAPLVVDDAGHHAHERDQE